MRHERGCICIVCEIQKRPTNKVRPVVVRVPNKVRVVSAPVNGKRTRQPGEKKTRRPGGGRKRSLPEAVTEAIVEALLVEPPFRFSAADIARQVGCTYEQVRTVKRRLALKTLQDQVISADMR